MSLVLKMLAAFGLGLYSCLGIHFYSILMSRAKSDVVRLRLVFLCVVLLVLLPIVAWGLLFSGVGTSWSEIHRLVIGGTGYLLWGGTVWIYVAINWRVLQSRLDQKFNQK